MKQLFLIFLALLAVALPVKGFLISPAQVEFAFAPGTTRIINMTVFNNEKTDKNLIVGVLYNWLPPTVQQELQGRVTTDVQNIQFRASDDQKMVHVSMRLPGTLSTGGTLEIRIAVTEESTTGMVGSRASNVMRILMFVPGQYVKASANVTKPPSNASTMSGNQTNQTAQINRTTTWQYNATYNQSHPTNKTVSPVTNRTANRTGTQPAANKTIQKQQVPMAADKTPPQQPSVEFVLPEEEPLQEEYAEQMPPGEEVPATTLPLAAKTPILPLLAAVVAGVSLLLIGTALMLPLLLRQQKPATVQYFYAANTLQGNDMPIAVLIENPNFTSKENVHLNIVMRDAENNFVKQLRHGPLSLAGNYRGTLNLTCRTDDIQPGNYLLELTVHAPNQSIRRFAHAQVYL